MSEPIVQIVKYLGKEKYAEFLSHIVSIHYLYEFPDVFLHESYYSFIKDTFQLTDEHMMSISNMSMNTNVLMNTLSVKYIHKTFVVSQPCSLSLLLQTIRTLLEDYDLSLQDGKSYHLNRIILSYEDRNLRMKILIKPSFVLSMFFYYPRNPEMKPSISKGYISNITHLHDVLVDNMLWIKQINNGEVYFQMIYTLYDIIDNKFLPTNQPLSYTQIANKYYYSTSTTTNSNESTTNVNANVHDELNEFFTNLNINKH